METQTETTTTTLKPPPPIAELRAEALREDAPPIPPAAAPAPLSTKRTPTADEIEEWRSAVDIAADELVDFYPELKGVYTDERRARLAERIAAVAVKYNVTPLGFIDRYKEEIALVLFLRPLARDTMRVIEAQQKRPAPASGVQGKASEVQPPPPAPDSALKPN